MSEDADEEVAEFSDDGSPAAADRDATQDGRPTSDADGTADERSPGSPAGEPSAPGDADESADSASISRSLGEGSDGPRGRDKDPFAELFEAATVDELDGDRVWARLQADESEPTVTVRDRELREIDKRTYCHQCPHFVDPPDVGCRHDGTTILELVDVRTFRVANCPVVLEEESLEDG